MLESYCYYNPKVIQEAQQKAHSELNVSNRTVRQNLKILCLTRANGLVSLLRKMSNSAISDFLTLRSPDNVVVAALTSKVNELARKVDGLNAFSGQAAVNWPSNRLEILCPS